MAGVATCSIYGLPLGCLLPSLSLHEVVLAFGLLLFVFLFLLGNGSVVLVGALAVVVDSSFVAEFIHILPVCLVLLLVRKRLVLGFDLAAVLVVSIVLLILLAFVCMCGVALIFFFDLTAILYDAKLLCYVHHLELLELEGPSILHPDIFTLNNTVKVVYKMYKLLIVYVRCV